MELASASFDYRSTLLHYVNGKDCAPIVLVQPTSTFQAHSEPATFATTNNLNIAGTVCGLGLRWAGGSNYIGRTSITGAWFVYKNQRVDVPFSCLVKGKLTVDIQKQIQFQEWSLKGKDLFHVSLLWERDRNFYLLAKNAEQAFELAIKALAKQIDKSPASVKQAIELQIPTPTSETQSRIINGTCK